MLVQAMDYELLNAAKNQMKNIKGSAQLDLTIVVSVDDTKPLDILEFIQKPNLQNMNKGFGVY
jgi:hypothetical protein